MSKEFGDFLKSFPASGKAYLDLFKSVMDAPTLDAKTKQLILIGAMTAQNYPPGVAAHVPQALNAGAVREEILEAILTPLPVSGINGVIECLQAALKVLDTPD
jgi:alkylhydroperoxidase/carboxymuconolactone decarboxylase family protein YurZ